MNKNWTARAPEGVKSWDRIRFQANLDDYRCVTWPPLGPYWCSGFNESHSTVVAYVPHGLSESMLKELWPEAKNIDRMQENVQITFSERFSKPEWWLD